MSMTPPAQDPSELELVNRSEITCGGGKVNENLLIPKTYLSDTTKETIPSLNFGKN